MTRSDRRKCFCVYLEGGKDVQVTGVHSKGEKYYGHTV